MNKLVEATRCYIASFSRPTIDPYYEANGFANGIILFAIPSLGILFKCRARGEPIDLEFAAFFALLRFLGTQLEKEEISHVLVLSSNAPFVFSFAGSGRHLDAGSPRDKMISKCARKFKISVGYVESQRNLALDPPVDFPSVPRDRQPSLKPDPGEQNKSEMRPIQKGIKV